MKFSTINNQINPFSKGFSQATIDFDHLTNGQKIFTVALSALMGLATIFLGGIGGFATFKALVDTFKAQKIQPGTDETADKTDQLGKEILNEETDIKKLPLETLLQMSTASLQDNKLILDDQDKDQEEINYRIAIKVGHSTREEQKYWLDQTKGNPVKFALVSYGIAKHSSYVISKTCEFLEECEWPNEEMKEQLLPDLVSSYIVKEGIYISPGETIVPGFKECYCISLNTRSIFGRGDFTSNSQPISSCFAKAIGLAIKQVADSLDEGIVFEVVIGQFRETRFTASMIAPILPYLKNIPGMVALDLMDVQNGFNEEHADVLLDIYRSQPNLQVIKINIWMSKEKKAQFDSERSKILKENLEKLSQVQNPSQDELLS